MIAADFYTPMDPGNVPTGEVRPVKGTPLDFTRPMTVGARFAQLGGKPQGYGPQFCPAWRRHELWPARFLRPVVEPRSGRVMEVFTTEPGVQLYTANWLDGSLVGKGGVVYGRHAGLCLETQHFPNSINIHTSSTLFCAPARPMARSPFTGSRPLDTLALHSSCL